MRRQLDPARSRVRDLARGGLGPVAVGIWLDPLHKKEGSSGIWKGSRYACATRSRVVCVGDVAFWAWGAV